PSDEPAGPGLPAVGDAGRAGLSRDPAGYRSFIDRQLADGRSMLEPAAALFCAAIDVRVASPHLLHRLLADDADEASSSSADAGGDSESLLSGFLAELKVVDGGDTSAEASGSQTAVVGFPAGFAPARLVVVFLRPRRPSATISAHVGRPFPSQQLPDALLLPIAFNVETLQQALPAACLAESSSTTSATSAAAALKRDADARAFVVHALRHCLAQRLRAYLRPLSGELQDDDANGTIDLLQAASEKLFVEPGFLPRCTAASATSLATWRCSGCVSDSPASPQLLLGGPENPSGRLHQQQPQQLQLTTSGGAPAHHASLRRPGRRISCRAGRPAGAPAVTLRRAADADDSAKPPLLQAELPCEVAPDDATARFLRAKRQLLLRAPVVGSLPPA
uniref:RWD domain-containing protein n=1 Tax=Macrostomum lignano TaxID=282301 RepID=A0A1I8FBJ7_9PLAT